MQSHLRHAGGRTGGARRKAAGNSHPRTPAFHIHGGNTRLEIAEGRDVSALDRTFSNQESVEEREAGRRDGANTTGGEGGDGVSVSGGFFPLLTPFPTQAFSFLS